MTLKRIRSLLAEILFFCLCLFASGYSVYQFWQSLNMALTKNEEAIATISFKYKTAQRKFAEDLLWDRLQQNSPVYEGDTIRTAPLSEATIYFSDGNVMNLYENTMARVSLKSGTAEVDFSGGQIDIQTENSATGMTIKSGNSIVNVEKGASITASAPKVTNIVASPEAKQKTEAVNDSDNTADIKNSTIPSGFTIQVNSGNAAIHSENAEEVVTLEAGQSAMFSETGGIQKKHLSVIAPANDVRYLIFDNGTQKVNFQWDCEDGEQVVLSFYKSKNMVTPVDTQTFIDEKEAAIELPAGVHWWKLTSGEDVFTGKINVIYSKIPQAIAPAEDYVAIYRTKLPGVRFIWSESERATSYELRIANNPQMENPVIVQRSSQTSSIISTLEKGTWYWTVTPYYMINNIGLAESSKVYSFNIQQSGALSKPELQIPADDGVVSTKIPIEGKGYTYKTVNFSWKDNPEAVSYEFKLWADKAQNSPIASASITNNYYSINTATTEIKNGLMFWQVKTRDVEGNVSESEIRKFYAIDSDIEQRTLFPPDNYKLASTRTQDIRYNWKTNIPYDTTFQVATDVNFTNIVHSETTSGTSVNGRELKPGTYFWRITTKVGDIGISTPRKTLYVSAPMSAPKCIAPAENSREVTRLGIPVQFMWTPVAGADYYQFKLYKKSDPDTTVYERNFIEAVDSQLVLEELIMDDMDETQYFWTVQAFSEETISSSRAAGFLATYNFSMKKLRPIKLVEPLNDTEFGGIQAVKEPANMIWSTVDAPKDAEIVIYKNTVSEENIFTVINQPKIKQQLPQLYEGQYYWKIIANTEDELDISSQEINRFSVAPMPKLPVPDMTAPAENLLIDIDYIINIGQRIQFKWKPLPEVSRYIFSLYRKNSKYPQIVKELDSQTTDFTLEGEDFINVLGKENLEWQWTVEAQLDYEGKLLQSGKTARKGFLVEIPRNKPGAAKLTEETEVRYGTDEEIEARNLAAAEKKGKKSTAKNTDSKIQNNEEPAEAEASVKSKKTRKSK